MFELLLIAVEKFVNEPKSFVVLIVACILGMICLNKYKKHVSRTIYTDKEFMKVKRFYLRKMVVMFLPISLLTHFILSYSNYLHNDYTNQPFLFIVYSIPLTVLTICQNIVKIMKEDNFSFWKAILAIIPGTSNYMLFYCFLSAVNKGIWFLVLIAILGIIIPVILDIIIIYSVSEKSKIKVKVYMNDGKVYDLEKRDLIDGIKETVLKIRDAKGKVSQSIVISSEKIDKKEYYRVEKKE